MSTGSMRALLVPILLSIGLLYACSQQAAQPVSTGNNCRTLAYFSRRGGAAASLIEALNSARQQIHVAIYSITHSAIVDALIAAKRRGVDVALKTDKTESEQKNQRA